MSLRRIRVIAVGAGLLGQTADLYAFMFYNMGVTPHYTAIP